MNDTSPSILRVTYMELRKAPASTSLPTDPGRITRERLDRATYLDLYRSVGKPLRWDQRLQMSEAELVALLEGGSLNIYVLRDAQRRAMGFCEFDRREFPAIELKNFGLVADAQGRGLGSWLLGVALREEWLTGPARIWLHTDEWDHPAAIRVYERAGIRTYAVRDEDGSSL